MRPRLVAVVGATGYVGGHLVPYLLERGHPVRCIAREPTKLRGRSWERDVDVARADASDVDAMTAALQGVEAVFYLVHSMAAGRAFGRRDREAALAFRNAAAAAATERVIYLGGLGRGALSKHLHSRQEVGEVLREGRTPTLELRAAIVIGSGSLSFEMLRSLVDRLPIMVCPRWVRTRCQPIAIADLVRCLTRALEVPAESRIVDIGGPDVLSYREMMLEYARIRGLRRRILTVPLLTPRLSSYWVDLVTPIPAAYARPLIEGLATEVVVERPDPLGVMNFAPLGYRESVQRALRSAEQGDRPTAWTSAALAPRRATGQPTVSVDTAGRLLRDERVIELEAPAEVLAAQFETLGGAAGWPYANWAWALRGLLDRAVGGIGLRRGRRHPRELLPGDALDFWRVEEIEPGRRLRLRAEMRLPGEAYLEFSSEPLENGRSRLRQTATLRPRGVWGRLYWIALTPIHGAVFGGLATALARGAVARAAPRPAGGTDELSPPSSGST